MHRVLLLVILLGFPVMEFAVAGLLARVVGWWPLLLWFVLAGGAGLTLMRHGRARFGRQLRESLAAGVSPLQALKDSGRLFLAGLLLLIPGVVTDLGALILLLGYRAPRVRAEAVAPTGPQTLDGEYHRIDQP